MHVLAHGGMMPLYQPPDGEKTSSPRRRGVKQGALLILIGAILVPIMGVMSAFAPGRLENVFAFFAAIFALLCFLGGPLRMLFAAIFEEGAKPVFQFPSASTYNTPAVSPARVAALPPPAINPAAQWRQPTPTAEINAPPSVTDSTTKLLDKGPKSE